MIIQTEVGNSQTLMVMLKNLKLWSQNLKLLVKSNMSAGSRKWGKMKSSSKLYICSFILTLRVSKTCSCNSSHPGHRSTTNSRSLNFISSILLFWFCKVSHLFSTSLEQNPRQRSLYNWLKIIFFVTLNISLGMNPKFMFFFNHIILLKHFSQNLR